jgi:predicted porin
MNRNHILVLAGIAFTGAVHAQSSTVTLYGSLDLGPNYITNVGGSSTTRVTGGTTQPDRIGFRGTEDLGGGLSALFGLESGIAPDTGTQINPTKFWNREAKLGLASTTLGTVALGHLTDTMFDYVGKASNGYRLFNFNLFHPGNFDGLANTAAFDNAVKYTSPDIGGFQGSLAIAAGEGVSGRQSGAGGAYASGPLRVAAAWTKSDQKALDIAGRLGIAQALGRSFKPGVLVTFDSVVTAGLGATYDFGKVAVNTVYTRNSFKLAGAEAKAQNFDLGANLRWTELNWINIGAQHQRFEGARWNTLSVMDLYWLSKRTQLYAQATMQRAGGDARFAAINGVGVSGSDSQSVLSVGMHHSF